MNHDIIIDFSFDDYVEAVGAAFYGDPKPKDYTLFPFNQYVPVSEFKTILSPNHTFDPARDRLDRLEYPALILGIDDVKPSEQRSIGNGQQLIDFTMKAFILYPREYKNGDRDITRSAMKVAAFVCQTRRFGQPVTPAVLLPEKSKAGEQILKDNEQVRVQSVCWEHTTAVGEDLYPPEFVSEPVKVITDFVEQMVRTTQTFEWEDKNAKKNEQLPEDEHWIEQQYDLYHEASQQP